MGVRVRDHAAGHGDAPSFHFHTTIDVRFRDLDAFGHVNNAVYLTYFEIARTSYFNAVHGRRLGVEDFGVVVAEAHCRYRSPAYLDERLVVEVATVTLRSRSFELAYRITDQADGRLVAEGRTVQVAFDHKARRTTTFPLAFRREIEAFEGRSFDSAHASRSATSL